MSVASRTPDGIPHRCPICDEVALVEPAWPGGDSVCPACGSWLLYFRDRVPGLADGLLAERDSLDTVELVMELEEELGSLGISISDIDAEQIQSVEELIRWLRQRGLDLDR